MNRLVMVSPSISAAGRPADVSRPRASVWASLRAVVDATGQPARTLRDRLLRLPDHARRKIQGSWWFDIRFAPSEWRQALNGRAPDADGFDPTEWRKADLARDSAIKSVLDQWKSNYATWRRSEPKLSERQADQRFCRLYGDGYFGRTFKACTLRAWRSQRRKGVTHFKETRGGKRGGSTPSIGNEARARFLGEYLNHGVGIRLAYQLTAGEAHQHPNEQRWAWPSEPTVRRWVHAEHAEFYTSPYRKGWRQWRADHEPKLIRDQHSLQANEIWEIDGTTADYFVRDNGRKVRPVVINCVDVATHTVVGSSVGRSESQETIIRAFRRAVEGYGAPLTVRTDLGKSFLGQAVGDARGRRLGIDVVGVFESLNITLETCIGRSPWQKGNAESVFNGFRQRYAPLHGRAFISNSHKTRVPGVDKWCDAHLDQLKTLEQDDALVGRFFEAENRRPRRQLGNLSPLQKFEATAIPKREVCPDLLDFLFARAQRVRVTNRGIPVTFGTTRLNFGQRDPRVWQLNGRQVVVRIDDDKPESIWLCDESGHALFKVRHDEVRGIDGAALREVGKRKAKARKAVREHWDNVAIAQRHPIDVAIGLQQEHADAQAAKNGKAVRRDRGRTIIAGRMAADVRRIQTEELKVAVGAEGMSPPPTGDLLNACAPPMDGDAVPAFSFNDIEWDTGQDDPIDDPIKELSRGSKP